jgi:hypothetical protein
VQYRSLSGGSKVRERLAVSKEAAGYFDEESLISGS